MPETARFIYVVCQYRAEGAAKKELLANHPELRFAFSRPGFLTFKLSSEANWPEKFALKSTLARTYGWSLEKVTGDDANLLIEQLLALPAIQFSERSPTLTSKSDHPDQAAADPDETVKTSRRGPRVDKNTLQLAPLSQVDPVEVRHIHLWERDARTPGHQGFEPGLSVLADEIGILIGSRFTEHDVAVRVNKVTRPNDCVLDIVLVEPNQWWIGYHYATTTAGRWPGGVPFVDPEVETVSRAYYKAAEALAWSGIEIQPGDWCAEIGSAPGGACQLLLEKGANVIGIDPAEMDESILASERFIHIRRRGNEVRKKDLADVKWLFADVNLVPNYTLDTITDILSHEKVNVRGLVLTMKLPDWKLLDKIPELRARVAALGFGVVKTRQLAFNRQEFCLVAVRDKFELRKGKQLVRNLKSKQATAKKARPKKKKKPETRPAPENDEAKPAE